MAGNNGNLLTFNVISENTDLKFEVISFHGHEAVSRHYEFNIKLRSKELVNDPDIIGKAGKFTIQMVTADGHDTEQSTYHGMVFNLNYLGKIDEYHNYQIILAPKLAKLKYSKNSNVFIESSLDEIVSDVFYSQNFTNIDHEIAFDTLDNKYKPSLDCYNRYSYVCQYEESDYNFINRILERDGVYYYFEQNDEGEKIVITDTKDKYLPRNEALHIHSKNLETVGIDPNRIEYIEIESKIVPQKVTITNFGYEKAHLGDNGVINCTANVSADGNEDPLLFGEEVIYGENFINPEISRGEEGEFGDGEFLAKIRAQEIFCQRRVYKAKSTALPISAGMNITIIDDNNPVFSGEYLVIEVKHSGHQSQPELDNVDNSHQRFYENALVLIRADVQFRPQRQTPWPRIYGTMNALIDGEGEELLYPQLDSKGRYKIRLPFLKHAKDDGKGSIWMRLATPYAGDSYGFHFPLHKGTEVVLSFRDGNPDLPVIMGAVFNSLHKNVVIDQNSYMGGVIMTKAENIFCMFDTKGAHSIGMATNNNWQQLQ